MRRIQYAAEYLFMRFFVFYVNLWPWKANRTLAVTFLPVMSLLGYKRLAADNILRSSLDLPREGKEFKKFLREVCVQNALTYIEMLKTAKMDKKQLMAHITIDNEDTLRNIYAEHGRVIFVLGHLGNWELLGQAVAYSGYPLSVIVRRQNNPATNRLVNAMREKAGIRIIYRDRTAVREVLKGLRNGEGVAILNDQDGGKAGVTTEFMGRKCSTPHGPVVFALKSGAPLSFVTVRRLKNGDSTAHIGEPFFIKRETDDLEADIRKHLQHLLHMLETEIAKYPEQWNWLANRWRTKR